MSRVGLAYLGDRMGVSCTCVILWICFGVLGRMGWLDEWALLAHLVLHALSGYPLALPPTHDTNTRIHRYPRFIPSTTDAYKHTCLDLYGT